MRKKNLILLFMALWVLLYPAGMSAQNSSRDIYGWIKYDDYNQDEYGICSFKSDNPGEITVVYPYDKTKTACAGAFADGAYYVYLYETDGYNATPLSFNRIDLSTGTMTQVADYRGLSALYQDMAYDYSTQTMYALAYDENAYTAMLIKVDLSDGSYSTVGVIGDTKYVGLACSYDGQLYAIDVDYGDLWRINKEDGSAEDIGYLYERVTDELQSMEFDHETNTLYWATGSTLCTIDTTTGEATSIGRLGNYAQVVGLYIPFVRKEAEGPAEVSDLTIRAGANGALSAQLSWKNPSQNMDGTPLTSLTKIEIYRNRELAHEIENPEIGGNGSWNDLDIPASGIISYQITVINEKGQNTTTASPLFIGRDIPSAPTGATLSVVGETSLKLSWTAPQTGINGGWIDTDALSYRIVRMPDQTVVAESFNEGTEYTDNTITSLNAYSYTVQAITPDGEGGTATSNEIVAGPALSVPYSCDFATEGQFALWNVIDANEDGYTWERETTLAAARYYYNEDGTTGGDDWLISSPIHLEKGKVYRLRFKLQSYDVGFPEKVAVYLGTGKEVADQTIQLGDYEIESNTFVEYKALLPENLESGDYRISFHCHSEPYMFILYVSGVVVEEVNESGISGTVTDGINALVGVEVTLKESGRKTMTDESGVYTFEELPTGNYTLLFDKTGYRSEEKREIAVSFGETAEVNVTMNALLSYAVSGKILNSNGAPVSQARLSLFGYTQYTALSETDGTFSFPQVYQSNGYSLIVERYGLDSDTLTVDVTDSAVALGEIRLTDKALPPYLLSAQSENNAIALTWRTPMDTRLFRHDNGVHGGRLGTLGSTSKSVYGSVFRAPATLTGMTWFTENYITQHATVNIFVFDLDANGEPTSHVLYSQMNVPNTDLTWTTFEFPEPVNAPNGYMLALSYEGHVGLGLDTGAGPDYPFEEHTNCYAEDYTTGKFTYTEEHDIRRTLMIRGIGIIYGDDQLPSAITDRKYSVWRLSADQKENPDQWQSLAGETDRLNYTDNTWAELKQGYYCYAVRAVYNSGNLISPAAFTEILAKDMVTQVVVNVTTNTPNNEAKGASIVLTHTDGNDEHVYTGTTDAQGKASFTNVWKGKYRIDIDLKGFETLTAETDLSTENSYELSGYTLQEYIVNPFNLEIAKTDKNRERLFRWNVTDALFDDFESHTDFVINSPGQIGWSYIDADGKETYGIDDVEYINATLPKAYIVFNPSETDPNVAVFNPGIRAHSGEKYLAAFPANPGANNDFVVSPELNFSRDFTLKFYAKSFSNDYGLELMNVGYSKTGKAAEDFEWLNGETPIEIPFEQWTEYRYVMPADAKYVTINCVSDNVMIFMLDDIFIGFEVPEGIDPEKMKSDLSFEVYLDGKSIGTSAQPSYTFTGLEKGMHKAGVKAVFSSVTTPMIEVEFEVDEESGIKDAVLSTRTISPNPAKEMVTVSGEYDTLSIYSVSGHEVARYGFDERIDVSSLPNGVYIVRILSGKQVEIAKLIVSK